MNNNAYTNRMAKFVFEKTVEFISEIKNEYKDCYDELDKKYDLKSLESIFDDSAKNLYIPQPDSKSGVIEQFDRILGKDQIAVFHINDSMNPLGAHKDRHANIDKGNIGYETLHRLVHDERFLDVPKILETPWVAVEGTDKKEPPYKEEIAWLLEK